MQNLFALLSAHYPSNAQCAAALGLSRQAYQQAQTRRRLSDRATIRAAALLNIDPGAALLLNHTAANDAPAPILDAAPNLPSKSTKNQPGNTNYANQKEIKEAANAASLISSNHALKLKA